MFKNFVLVCLCFGLLGCTMGPRSYDEHITRPPEDRIIPTDQLTREPCKKEASKYTARDYSSMLRLAAGMERPTDLAVRENATVYRFTWQRSFDDSVIITILKKAPLPHLVSTRAWKRSGVYEEERRMQTVGVDKVLSGSNLHDLEAQFAEQSYRDLTNLSCRRGLDGSFWTIEMANADSYHFVTRWTPDETNPIRIIGEKFIELSGEAFGPIY